MNRKPKEKCKNVARKCIKLNQINRKTKTETDRKIIGKKREKIYRGSCMNKIVKDQRMRLRE